MRADFETRSLMVLQEEAARVSAAAERVRLVVQAMAQRRGLPAKHHSEPSHVVGDD